MNWFILIWKRISISGRTLAEDRGKLYSNPSSEAQPLLHTTLILMPKNKPWSQAPFSWIHHVPPEYGPSFSTGRILDSPCPSLSCLRISLSQWNQIRPKNTAIVRKEWKLHKNSDVILAQPLTSSITQGTSFNLLVWVSSHGISPGICRAGIIQTAYTAVRQSLSEEYKQRLHTLKACILKRPGY